MTSPATILSRGDEHYKTPRGGFNYKISCVLRSINFLIAMNPSSILSVFVEDENGKRPLEIKRGFSVVPEPHEVVNKGVSLLFDSSNINKIIEINARAERRQVDWEWFTKAEAVLSNYKTRLDFSIISGINIYKESGTHDMITTPGLIRYAGELYTTPEFIIDLRPEIANIPPRGSMLKVFFLNNESVISVPEDHMIDSFESITIFLAEGQAKEEYDTIISDEIYSTTDSDKSDIHYIEIARVWVKDFLHRPPALEVTYDLRVKCPQFLNWSI